MTPLDSEILRESSRQRAHLLMCCDSAYFQHVAVCLSSLLEHNRQIDFDAVVLVTRHTVDSAEKLKRSLANRINLNLRVLPFDNPELSKLPLANHYPSEIYARFWVDDYFGHDVERVIYLDGDMVIVGSIADLLAVPLDDNVLAAVSIPGSMRSEVLGYDPSYEYFNSGVLVINLERWRDIGARDLLITAAHQLSDKLNDPDQDVLNYCFFSQRVKLDYVWNAITPFFRKKNYLSLTTDEISRVVRDARIVHFNGPSKPWQYLCRHPFKNEYLRHLALTEWRDFRPKDYNAANILKRFIVDLIGERVSSILSTIFRYFLPKRA